MRNFLLLIVACMLTVSQAWGQAVILDFESPATTSKFIYFGNAPTPDNDTLNIIPNPDPTGANTSATVLEFVRDSQALVFAGATTPATQFPATLMDFTSGAGEVCAKIWVSKAGNFRLKLESATPSTGPNGGNWEQEVAITAADLNKWIDVCFDITQTGINGGIATGKTFAQPTIFFDFGTAAPNVQDTYYFDSLYTKAGVVTPPGDSINVTFNLSFPTGVTADPGGVFIAGGAYFGAAPNAFELTDGDMDGIYSGTFRLPDSFAGNYTFTNGPCADYSCKENIQGQACADGPFSDRFVDTLTADTSINHCFGICTENGEFCPANIDSVTITVNIQFPPTIAVDTSGVFLAGGSAFGGAPNAFEAIDDNSDGTYTLTFKERSGFTSFFTITNGACPDYSCKEMIAGQACANPGNFDDRLMDNITSDTTLNLCFENCDGTSCNFTSNDPKLDNAWLTIVPSMTDGIATVRFGNQAGLKQISLLNSNGQLIKSMISTASSQVIDLQDQPTGLYFVRVQAGDQIATQKVIRY